MDSTERVMLEGMGYKVNDRTFGSLKSVFSDDYFSKSFVYSDDDVVYSGAEDSARCKYPNITHLPHLQLSGGGIILGQTFGHQHISRGEREFQEFYEFQGYGGLLLQSKKNGRRLHLLAPGDQAIVMGDDNMTIFNFGCEPLVTLDYANPELNDATKRLEQKVGSLFIMENLDGETEIKLNSGYCMAVGMSYSGSNLVKVKSDSLGEFFLEALMGEEDFFNDKGIRVSRGGNVPVYLDRKLKGKSLKELVLNRDRTLMNSLWM